MAAKLNVPLPLTTAEASTSYQAFSPTEPIVPSVAPSMAGWLFQVVPVSDHDVLEIARNVPPAGLPELPLIVRSRILALVTVPLTPETVNRRNERRTGELSTTSWVDVP